jgi:hypothetical protein
MKNGTIKHSDDIDFTGDVFKRTSEKDPGWYVMFGFWKGPFESKEAAQDAYREWAWEAKNS